MDTSHDSCDAILSRITAGLNPNQLLAVTAPAKGRLQIIAGPGTGKTKVLVSRVAYLLIKEKIQPNRIVVTTFTKKAANEMTERLAVLLNGSGQNIDIAKLLIGTFHSICFRILKIYGKKMDFEGFNVADERDSDQIMKEVLERLNRDDLAANKEAQEMFKNNKSDKLHGFDHKKLKNHISKLKSNNILPEDSGKTNPFLRLIYKKYQLRLQEAKLFDFDDCLVYCHRLIKTHPVLNFVQHVLVDEFQDTNEVQLQLMYEFAKGHSEHSNNVTIVGDPDQSIYGFRNAQSANFQNMKNHYSSLGLLCQDIHLTDNYRSTSDVLNFSESIMRQQPSRIKKNLQSVAKTSFKHVHEVLSSPEQEARWMVYQIEHLMALPSCPFKFEDISVIVRAASQTRVIENEFVRRRIPYIMVRGKAFWDRKEVVAVLDYLRIVASDHDRVAFLRTMNFPKRGIGQASLAAIETLFDQDSKQGVLQFATLKGLVNGNYNVKVQGKSNLAEYLKFIENAKVIMNELDHIDESKFERTLLKLFDFVYTESGLKKEFDESKDQQLNIMEVQKQLCEFKPKEEDLTAYIGSTEESPEDNRTFLNKFLQSIGLYESQSHHSTGDDDGDKSKGKISISTIHGSKGLEWPVVFVPGLTDGLVPASFAMKENDTESVDEERRCFYVATTRPKTLLYLSSYTEVEGKWGRAPMTEISRFLKQDVINKYISKNQLAFQDSKLLEQLYEMVGISYSKSKVDNFDISIFNKLYLERKRTFIQGAEFDIVGQDYGTNVKKSLLGGFVSAKQHFGKFPPVGLKRSKSPNRSGKRKLHQAALLPSTMSTINTISSNCFIQSNNVSKPISVNKAPRNFAPTYVPSPRVTTNVVKKAPPYIPNRKA